MSRTSGRSGRRLTPVVVRKVPLQRVIWKTVGNAVLDRRQYVGAFRCPKGKPNCEKRFARYQRQKRLPAAVNHVEAAYVRNPKAVEGFLLSLSNNKRSLNKQRRSNLKPSQRGIVYCRSWKAYKLWCEIFPGIARRLSARQSRSTNFINLYVFNWSRVVNWWSVNALFLIVHLTFTSYSQSDLINHLMVNQAVSLWWSKFSDGVKFEASVNFITSFSVNWSMISIISIFEIDWYALSRTGCSLVLTV